MGSKIICVMVYRRGSWFEGDFSWVVEFDRFGLPYLHVVSLPAVDSCLLREVVLGAVVDLAVARAVLALGV